MRHSPANAPSSHGREGAAWAFPLEVFAMGIIAVSENNLHAVVHLTRNRWAAIR